MWEGESSSRHGYATELMENNIDRRLDTNRERMIWGIQSDEGVGGKGQRDREGEFQKKVNSGRGVGNVNSFR